MINFKGDTGVAYTGVPQFEIEDPPTADNPRSCWNKKFLIGIIKK